MQRVTDESGSSARLWHVSARKSTGGRGEPLPWQRWLPAPTHLLGSHSTLSAANADSDDSSSRIIKKVPSVWSSWFFSLVLSDVRNQLIFSAGRGQGCWTAPRPVSHTKTKMKNERKCRVYFRVFCLPVALRDLARTLWFAYFPLFFKKKIRRRKVRHGRELCSSLNQRIASSFCCLPEALTSVGGCCRKNGSFPVCCCSVTVIKLAVTKPPHFGQPV